MQRIGLVSGYFGATVAVLIGVAVNFLYYYQDKILYARNFPAQSRYEVLPPNFAGIEDFEKIEIPTPDGEILFSWFFKCAVNPESANTIIYHHGNAGNISHRLQNVRELLSSLRVNILIFDYRGYGFSTGTPSEEGLQLDSQAVLDYLLNRKDIDRTKIIAFGRSLGGAVVIDLAYRNPQSISALIIENSFTSIPSLIDYKFPNLSYLNFLCKSDWCSIVKIKNVKQPTLFLSGLNDTLVPPKMMLELYESSISSNKHLFSFSAGHNDTWTISGYYKCIGNWLSKIEKS